jgi:hypothetical protein
MAPEREDITHLSDDAVAQPLLRVRAGTLRGTEELYLDSCVPEVLRLGLTPDVVRLLITPVLKRFLARVGARNVSVTLREGEPSTLRRLLGFRRIDAVLQGVMVNDRGAIHLKPSTSPPADSTGERLRLARPCCIAVVGVTAKCCVDFDWGPLLAAAFSDGTGIIKNG